VADNEQAASTPTVRAVGPVGGKARTPEEYPVVDSLVPGADAGAGTGTVGLICPRRRRAAPRRVRALSDQSSTFAPYEEQPQGRIGAASASRGNLCAPS